jgi:flavin reductase (DIM6/NTAB) family NADH-FMN oxidoreductase RutF
MNPISIAQAMSMKFPEWVTLLIVRDTEAGGRPNIMPLGWLMCCSFEPPMIALAVGNSRYTHELLTKSPRFVVAFAGEGQADLVRRTGSSSGRDGDKFKAFEIPCANGAETDCPLLTEAALNLECEVTGTLITGDHTIFAAKVLAAYAPERPIRKIVNWGSDRLAPAAPA